MGVEASRSNRLAIGFSWAAHSLMHILAGLFLTVVLVLEREWKLSYDELLPLWTLGSLMIGLGAPVAGWLGDRWSNNWMLVIFYILSGSGAVIAGLAGGPSGMELGLAVMGLGCSIYHPVGMSMVVRHSSSHGKAMGWFGLFGTVGVALAGILAGALIDFAGWRSVFLAPGAVCVVLGIVYAACLAAGMVAERKGDVRPQAAASRDDVMKAFFILSVTMVCAGMMFNGLQLVLPKLVELELSPWLGKGFIGVGGLVTAINLSATIPMIIGGHLADRVPLKRIYVTSLGIQSLMMAALAALSGPAVVAAAGVVVMVMQIQSPAENLLLTRYTPDRHRGLIFGAKFILIFGIGPLSVQMVSAFYRHFGGFGTMYLTLAGLVVCGTLAGSLLPSDRRNPAPAVRTTAAEG